MINNIYILYINQGYSVTSYASTYFLKLPDLGLEQNQSKILEVGKCRLQEFVSTTGPVHVISDEALSLIIERKLSKNQYNLIRKVRLQNNSVLHPAYKYVL